MKYHCFMNTGGHEKTVLTVSIILLFIVLLLLIPGTGAVATDSGRQAFILQTPPDLNMTNISWVNHTVPAHQAGTPVGINFQIEVSDTLLPAQKGEMAAGPRTIDLTAPVSFAVLVLIIGAVAAGAVYILKRRPDEDTEEKPDEDTEWKPYEDTEK